MTSFRSDYGRAATASATIAFLLATALLCLPKTVDAASFDCERPELAADEKVICDTRALNDADVKMVTTFDILSNLLPMGARGTMQDEQLTWLKKRQACNGDVDCLRASYTGRLKQLDETFKNLSRPL